MTLQPQVITELEELVLTKYPKVFKHRNKNKAVAQMIMMLSDAPWNDAQQCARIIVNRWKELQRERERERQQEQQKENSENHDSLSGALHRELQSPTSSTINDDLTYRAF